ncbi:hypothetical protein L2E82_01613 [Cichorium intybus]|uniref:Uncharacterized protein n=1 Tax=Cichorium intybus TaxID=13427 RepID=A0ACB9GZC5_CICIN|nr:hypothetical protein L2E82_01613 [Cichorium intybus]
MFVVWIKPASSHNGNPLIRWDFYDGKDRWASGSESDDDPKSDDAKETDATGQESNETQELSNRTKRMSIEIEPSDIASSKKKKKIKST